MSGSGGYRPKPYNLYKYLTFLKAINSGIFNKTHLKFLPDLQTLRFLIRWLNVLDNYIKMDVTILSITDNIVLMISIYHYYQTMKTLSFMVNNIEVF